MKRVLQFLGIMAIGAACLALDLRVFLIYELAVVILYLNGMTDNLQLLIGVYDLRNNINMTSIQSKLGISEAERANAMAMTRKSVGEKAWKKIESQIQQKAVGYD